jgi:hypothetical protein
MHRGRIKLTVIIVCTNNETKVSCLRFVLDLCALCYVDQAQTSTVALHHHMFQRFYKADLRGCGEQDF